MQVLPHVPTKHNVTAPALRYSIAIAMHAKRIYGNHAILSRGICDVMASVVKVTKGACEGNANVATNRYGGSEETACVAIGVAVAVIRKV